MSKKAVFRLFCCAVIAGGILLMLYPPFTHIYSAAIEKKYQNNLLSSETAHNASDNVVLSKKNNISEEIEKPFEENEFKGFILNIPVINLTTAVMKGTDSEVLRKTPGWYEESALPGQGNTAIAGHRTMYGGWFKNLDRLKNGDKIFLLHDGVKYCYLVESVFEVNSNDWSIIESCEFTALTLTTCKKGDEGHRMVVRAKMV